MSESEKRQHERAVVRFAVRVCRQDGAEIEGTVENLGGLGALVMTTDLETAVDVGDRVALHIDRPAGALSVNGEIVRVDQEFAAGDICRSFAVRFDAPVDP